MSNACPMCGSPIPPPEASDQDVRFDSLVRAVLAHYRVFTRAELLGPRRTKGLAGARQVLAYLLRRLTPMSYPEIGRALNRDHTTVMAACRKVGDTQDPRLLADIERILTLVGETDPLRKAG